LIARGPSHNVSAALVGAFQQMDQIASTLQKNDAGSTACVACVRADSIVVANAGDCRAVLCRKGKAIDLSRDHKPNLPDEEERIIQAGSYVEQDGVGLGKEYRVNGDLAVSRAIGDFSFKRNARLPPHQQAVIATPDVQVFQRQPDDEFMIIACDGIWDVMNSKETVAWFRKRLGDCKTVEARLLDGSIGLCDVVEEFLDHCLRPQPKLFYGIGEDNMTAVVVVFLKSFWRRR